MTEQDLTLRVNGETHRVIVTPRTQLAEILRDQLDLTGTHLACEQGVCGACTVMMNGRPVRSCITYAGACDGAVIETIEGFRGDPVMDRLREAFSRHHALQCGFCTPGMLTTARDIVARFEAPDEATIRHELSGNLCRCTGYVGIVAAITDVIAQTRADGTSAADPPAVRPRPHGFKAFTPAPEADPEPAAAPAAAGAGSLSVEGAQTVIRRAFALNHPPEEVWALFRDPARVATCIPGASITSVEGDRLEGAIEIRFGPIRARFGGNGTFQNDDDTRAGKIHGQGDDKSGKSRVQADLVYRIKPGETGTSSSAEVELRYQLEGMLAQFNRPELVTGFVDYILGQFIANCEATLSGAAMPAAAKLNMFALFWAVAKSFFRRR